MAASVDVKLKGDASDLLHELRKVEGGLDDIERHGDLDVNTKGGVRSLGQLRTELKSTEGSFGKMKVAGSGALDQIKAHGTEMALAGGAALVAFGAKAVTAFTDGAIAAGQFADATGLSTEQASQWNSVADDLGLSSETLQKSFLKMNKEIGEGGGLIDKYGLKLQTTADGAADVNGTMLETIRVIGGIKDPTERAAAAQEVFGRSYAEVAEIVLGDSAKINAALKSTSEQQIFDENEVKKARDYRAAMDNLNDVFTDVTMTLGQELTPAITEAADGLAEMSRTAGPLLGQLDKLNEVSKWVGPRAGIRAVSKGWQELGSVVGIGGGKVEDSAEALAKQEAAALAAADGLNVLTSSSRGAASRTAGLTDAQRAHAAALGTLDSELGMIRAHGPQAAKALEELGDAAADSAEEVDRITEAFDALSDAISDDNAWLDVADSFDDVAAKAKSAAEAAKNGGQEAEQAARDHERALNRLKQEVIDYATEIGNIPPETVSSINTLIDEGSFAEAEARLASLERHRTALISAQTIIRNAPSSDFGGSRSTGRISQHHTGGTFRAARPGGEGLALLSDRERILRPGEPAPTSGGGGGQVFNINVTAGMGTNGPQVARMVADEVRKASRRGL